MDILLLAGGFLSGSIVVTLLVLLTRRWLPTPGAALGVGLAATLLATYVSLRLSWWLAERYMQTEVVPQWEAQGHLDNGPSVFVAVGSVATSVALAVLLGGLLATSVLMAMRMAR